MKLIDKSALVAEIERRRKEAESNCGGYKSYDEHRCDACIVGFYEEFLEIINTIEVKESDETAKAFAERRQKELKEMIEHLKKK